MPLVFKLSQVCKHLCISGVCTPTQVFPHLYPSIWLFPSKSNSYYFEFDLNHNIFKCVKFYKIFGLLHTPQLLEIVSHNFLLLIVLSIDPIRKNKTKLFSPLPQVKCLTCFHIHNIKLSYKHICIIKLFIFSLTKSYCQNGSINFQIKQISIYCFSKQFKHIYITGFIQTKPNKHPFTIRLYVVFKYIATYDSFWSHIKCNIYPPMVIHTIFMLT